MIVDAERQAAILELMAMPDPPDLEPRTHSVTVEGRADRFAVINRLAAVYVAHDHVQRQNERMQ